MFYAGMSDAQIMIYGRWKSLSFLKYLLKFRETTKTAMAAILNPNILTMKKFDSLRSFTRVIDVNSAFFFLRRGVAVVIQLQQQNFSRVRDQFIGSHYGVNWGDSDFKLLVLSCLERVGAGCGFGTRTSWKEVRVLNSITSTPRE